MIANILRYISKYIYHIRKNAFQYFTFSHKTNSIHCLGMPDIELGINDMWRQGKEVVGRHDIIPVVTEEWIRLENVEFHSCVQLDEYEKSRIIKYVPYFRAFTLI